jgi:hypothetical protein
LHLGEKLRSAPFEPILRLIRQAGAFLVGVCLMLLFDGRPITSGLPRGWTVLAMAAALTGSLLGARIRGPLVVAVAGFALFTILARILS